MKILLALALVSGVANAADFKYTCFPGKGNQAGLDSQLSLSVSGQSATINMSDKSYSGTGQINLKYHSPNHPNNVQYAGFPKDGDYSLTLIADNTLGTGGTTLPKGGIGGYITIRGQWDDFISGSFVCKK